VPDVTGRYTITIKYGGDNIPYSPYNIQALPTGDASKCLLTGTLSILVLGVLCFLFETLLLLIFLLLLAFYFQCLLEDMVLVRNKKKMNFK